MITPLRLDHYVVDKISVEANGLFDRRDERVGTIDVDPQHLLHKDQADVHQLILRVSFGAAEADPAGAPYIGEIVGRGLFHLEGEDLSDEQKARLVIVNGAAILFGLLRGQVAQVTAMSHYGTFLLPPVNLVEAFNDKAKANMELVDSGDEG